MARHFFVLLIAFFSVCSSGLSAQFDLSEPVDAPESSSEKGEPDTSSASKTPVRRLSGPRRPGAEPDSQAPRTRSALRSEDETSPRDSADSLSDDPGSTANEGGKAASEGAVARPASKSARNELTESLPLIDTDTVPAPFFSGPVPRTAAIGLDASLNDVCHVGPHCWAVGERGVICRSSDGGVTWTTQFLPVECSLKSVCFLTSRIGWVAGSRINRLTVDEQAVLFRTRDGGLTWQDLAAVTASTSGSADGLLQTGLLPGIHHVQYFGLEEAVAVTSPVVGSGGHGIVRSSDGGKTWSVVPGEDPGAVWTAGRFLSPSEGIVAGRGQAWAAVVSNQTVMITPPDSTRRRIRGVSLDSEGTGWIAGDGGIVFSTSNTGVTWTPATRALPESVRHLVDFHTVAHQGKVVLIAGAPGSCILRSGNAGTSWDIHPVPVTGRIHRLCFLSETEVLAVGSFGQILRSEDTGLTWAGVRSPGVRTAVLDLVTENATASWRLLASLCGDQGFRGTSLQISQAAEDARPEALHRAAMTQLGGCDTASDWMFPRDSVARTMSKEDLLTRWNLQTDGRLRELLPLRLAREIRSYQPSVIVIEPGADQDPVAGILRDVMASAIRLAESESEESVSLESLGLKPWSVHRVLAGTDTTQQTHLRFNDTDLLVHLSSTTGLICDGVIPASGDGLQTLKFQTRSDYELLYDSEGRESVRHVLDGLEGTFRGARRDIPRSSPEEIEHLKSTAAKAQIEASALKGHTSLSKAEGSLIAELQTVGSDLPENLAVRQLRELSAINLEQNNMEGYLAVQQELVRRFPASIDAVRAAEMLYLFYSSAELRHFRMRSMLSAAERPIPRSDADQGTAPVSDVNGVLQPVVQPVSTQAFPDNSGSQLSALSEKWDEHAATAWKILRAGFPQDAQLPPGIQLRRAANLRMQNLTGEYNSLASAMSQRNDAAGRFALSDFQVSNPGTSVVIHVVNLPLRKTPPFLDGMLTDDMWEAAEELRLLPTKSLGERQERARNDNRPSESRDNSSLVMLSADTEFLYLAARLARPASDSTIIEKAAHRSHDAEHRDFDRLTLEIDTDRDLGTAFQFVIDETGRTSERCWFLESWNPKWYVATDANTAAWVVEAAIPLTSLSSPPAKPGTLWAVRILRSRPGQFEQELVLPDTPASGGVGFIRFIRGKAATKK